LTWFIFRTAPQREIIADKILKRVGFEAYTPVRREYRFANRYARHRKEKTLKKFPLMVGYVFIQLKRNQIGQLFANRSRFGLFDCVKSVVGVGGRPFDINDEIMQNLIAFHKNRHRAPGSYRHMNTHKEFEVGDTVRVVEGPFREFDVVVEEIDGGALTVFFDAFGRVNKTTMPVGFQPPQLKKV
jgi:transcription antitermination factor NusG